MRTLDLSRFEPVRAQAAAYWGSRSPREQWLLGILGTLLALAAVIVLIVQPLQEARADALADIRTYETLSARIRAAGPNLGSGGRVRAGAPATVISGSAAEFGLTVGRVDAEGAGTRVGVSGAPYDGLLRWIAELERATPMRAREVRLTRSAQPGRVDASLLLANP